MKKILFVRTVPYDFNPNTYNVQGFGLGKAFCKMGYDFDFLYFSKDRHEEYTLIEENGHRVKVISKPRIRIFRTGVCTEICKCEFLGQYDFVISCEYNQYMTYALSKYSENVAMYSGPYYNLFFFPFVSPLYDLFFTKKINRNIRCKFVKSLLAKEFLESKGYTDIESIGVALDIERFDKNVKIQSQTRQIVEFMQRNRCILYVGALSERKNFPFILEVYKKIVAKVLDVRFVIIGKGDSKYVGKYISKLSDIERTGIYHLECIENAQLKYIYPLAKAFLLPSKLEIFGMVLLEAMYLGAPVVTSWNGGSATLINGRETGMIVREFDSNKWRDAVLKYLSNPQFVDTITQNAHKLIKNEYNWTAIAQKMLRRIEGEHKL